MGAFKPKQGKDAVACCRDRGPAGDSNRVSSSRRTMVHAFMTEALAVFMPTIEGLTGCASKELSQPLDYLCVYGMI